MKKKSLRSMSFFIALSMTIKKIAKLNFYSSYDGKILLERKKLIITLNLLNKISTQPKILSFQLGKSAKSTSDERHDIEESKDFIKVRR